MGDGRGRSNQFRRSSGGYLDWNGSFWIGRIPLRQGNTAWIWKGVDSQGGCPRMSDRTSFAHYSPAGDLCFRSATVLDPAL